MLQVFSFLGCDRILPSLSPLLSFWYHAVTSNIPTQCPQIVVTRTTEPSFNAHRGFLWRRAQALVWTSMFLYKVLQGKNSFKSALQTRGIRMTDEYSLYHCYTTGWRIVTLILKKKHNTVWNHPLWRISAIVKSVWNSPGLSGSTWWDNGLHCILEEETGIYCRIDVLCPCGAGFASLPWSLSSLATKRQDLYVLLPPAL